MANIYPRLIAEIDPSKPVQEICNVISAVIPYHLGQEEAILRGVIEAAENRLKELKGAEKNGKPVREPGWDGQDQR